MKGVTVTADELIQLRIYAATLFSANSKKSSSPIAGSYTSPFRGRGIDFSEVRLYQPGDDIRQMDWRVTARTGKPHTKLFTEERERPVLFFIDMRRSMKFGTRVEFKSVLAAKCASLLAWAATGHGDRAGCLVVHEHGVTSSVATGGKRGVSRIIRLLADASELSSAENSNEIRFDDAIKANRTLWRPGSLVYVISDFHDFKTLHMHIYADIARVCDLVFIHVYDPLEIAPPPPADYWISNGSEISAIDAKNRKFREHVNENFTYKQNRLRSFCSSHGALLLNIATNDDWKTVLTHGLRTIAKQRNFGS